MEDKKIEWAKPDLIEMGNAGYTLGSPCTGGATAEICHSGGTASSDCTPGVIAQGGCADGFTVGSPQQPCIYGTSYNT
jgi:hypothetical protein